MKFNAKEDLKRLFVVCLASVIMALNINHLCGREVCIREVPRDLRF